eukprot:13790192-Ditylum_brightwellii.AAC.1
MEWVSSANTFANMMDQQPQAAVAGFARLLQCKWTYLQHSVELTGDAFNPLEEAIHWRLLPALFHVPTIPDDLQDLTALPIRQGGLGALHPPNEALQNRATSEACTCHLIEASLGLCIFESNQHLACLKHGRVDGKKKKEEE